jgi:DNA-binding transcriptional ArsR family regulator
MSDIRKSSENYRVFILENIEKYPSEIAKAVSEKFKISRQAANKHLQKLVEENVLAIEGKTKARVYSLKAQVVFVKNYLLDKGIAEDIVWLQDIRPQLGKLPDNVMNIWDYCFTEMFNNVIDHSAGSLVAVRVSKSAVSTRIEIQDDGVGIFKKIQKQLGLLDERHAVLELAKGKFTTDPANHTGEGIFFSSRACDDYAIISGGVYFSHEFGKKEDWIIETDGLQGTTVIMKLNNHTSRRLKKVFDEYATVDGFGFNKTVVPVKLAQYGDDLLVSRSQAKRVLNRVDRFKTVLFDFTGVDSIGQAFADEIFRVFAMQHPNIEIVDIRANKAVSNMISRARVAAQEIIDNKDSDGKQVDLF